jgi:hypothetical protein
MFADLPARDRARGPLRAGARFDLRELRARRICESGGFLAAEDALYVDGAERIKTNIRFAEVF